MHLLLTSLSTNETLLACATCIGDAGSLTNSSTG